jgi:tetratricopeptide (TPR) repeat protein
MSALSAPPINPNLDSSNLEQLKLAAIALEDNKKHEEALAKYEEVLVIQQRDLPVGDLDTHDTLVSIDRCIDQLKYASIDNLDVASSASSLFDEGKHADSFRLDEQTYERQLVTHVADHRTTLITRYNMAISLQSQQRYTDALSMFEPLLKQMSRVLPLDDPQTLTTMSMMAGTLCRLKRHDEGLKMYEDVVRKLISGRGEDHDDTLQAMFGMANTQFTLERYDDANRTATRGLLLARRVGNDEAVADFVKALSKLGEIEEAKSFVATASDEQVRLKIKINLRKQAKEKAAEDEAALLATRAKATTEDDLDALMAEFGFEEGDDCSCGKGEKKQSGGGSKKKNKKKKKGK